MSDDGERPGPFTPVGPSTNGRRRANSSFGVGRIALRQLRSRPALAIAQGVTLAAAATLLASVVLIQESSTNNGLRSGLGAASGSQGATVVIERDGVSGAVAFDAFQRDAAARVRHQLGNAVTPGAQYGSSQTQILHTIDGVQQGQPFSNLSSVSFYAGLRDHVRVVAGRWPTDTRSGDDWLLTASARATDVLGTPLNIRVGSEYCFSPSLARGGTIRPWCGRVTATWLPTDVSDPYWAGHIPETSVVTGHDSFFQILAQYPAAITTAVQQYAPVPANISSANAGGVVAGVDQLRGYYSVSSNDVFVSGLDTTISAFLARQSAAAGPTLVSAFGLLVVALAATGFAALQFMNGQGAEVSLWRARGWSRPRAWTLYSIQFAVLALAATPVAIVVSAAIATAVSGSAATRSAFGWQSLADASIPALIAAGAFLVILAGLAAVRSGPQVTNRRSGGSATSRRSWRRRATDVAAAAAGAGILLFVRSGGADPSGTGQTSGVLLVLPVLAVGLLAFASLGLVSVAARVLTLNRSIGGRLARWQVERDPAQYARLCLLVTLAVAVGVFASTYTASDQASALDRADHMVGADMRATFSSAASPPQLTALSASLPAAASAAQVFRSVGRPGRSGTDATVLGIQGSGFWNIAYARADYAAQPLSTLTSMMDAQDPDGAAVPGTPRALSLSVYSSGLDGRIDIEVTDASGRDALLPLGTLGTPGWSDRSAPVSAAGAVSYPLRVRAVRLTPTGSRTAGDVAVERLRSDSGAGIESFAQPDGWWQEAFAPDTGEALLAPTAVRSRAGEMSVDVPVNLSAVLLLPPPSSHPLPVLLASQTMAALGVSIGQSFPLHMDTVNVQLVPVGSFDEFPTHYPQLEDLIVVPMSSLLSRLGNQGDTSPWPNELWLKFPSGDTTTVNTRVSADSTLLDSSLRSDAESAALSDPLRVGLHDELGLGFIVALAVVVIGFGLHFLAAARNRSTQLALMRASGIPQSTLRRSLIAEQLVVLLTGLCAGTAIGLAVAWSVVPIFHLGALPQDVTPPSVFQVAPVTLLAVVAGTGAAALLMGRAVAGAGTRVDVMAAVRSLA